MHRTATAATPTTDAANVPVYRDIARARIAAAIDAFSAGDNRAARASLVDARAVVQELINHDPDCDALHVAFNAIGTAGMLVPPVTPQYARLAHDSIPA